MFFRSREKFLVSSGSDPYALDSEEKSSSRTTSGKEPEELMNLGDPGFKVSARNIR